MTIIVIIIATLDFELNIGYCQDGLMLIMCRRIVKRSGSASKTWMAPIWPLR